MGRTGKLKKKCKRIYQNPRSDLERLISPNLATSIHSRAARRETSPSDANKSLESVPRVETPKKPSGVLAAQSSAGISKKKSKTKALTRAQRLRQQKGVERAENVVDQLENKVAKSITKAKAIDARRVG
jgi:Alb1